VIVKQKPSTDYQKQETKKDMIVLHYTGGGSLSGAEATLAKKDYVNVHYCIDLNGDIIQYFDDKFWAYHTGTTKTDAKRSIGIEIVNWGHLTRRGDALYSWTGKLIPWVQVVKCEKFRGFEYWQKLTTEQESALAWLLCILEKKHDIKLVVSHAQLKPTKLDYPPDYPQIKNYLRG